MNYDMPPTTATETSRAALEALLHLPAGRRMVEGLSLSFEMLGLAPAVIPAEDAAAIISGLQRGLAALAEQPQLPPSKSAVTRTVAECLRSGRWRKTTVEWARRGLEIGDFVRTISAAREVAQWELERSGTLCVPALWLVNQVLDILIEEGSEAWNAELTRQRREVQDRLIRLNGLGDMARTVRSTVDLQPVLQSIVNKVCESGPWTMAAIGIVEEEQGELRVPAQRGFAQAYPPNMTFPATGSATLAAIRQAAPLVIEDACSSTEYPILPGAARLAGYRSILIVPLLLQSLQAVLSLCTPDPHRFTDEEVAFAKIIAQQVAIAIDHAQRYERERQTVQELEELNRLVAEQNRLLQRAASHHLALTQLVLDDKGLESIVNALSELVGNPIAVEDRYFHLLAHSHAAGRLDQHRRETIAAGGTPPSVLEQPAIRMMIEQIQRERRAVLMPPYPEYRLEFRRLIAPIVLGEEILGYVWVLESEREFESADYVTLEQATIVLALEMMKQRVTLEVERRHKADFFGDLLAHRLGEDEQALVIRGAILGYNLSCPSLVFVVGVSETVRATEENTFQRRVTARRELLEATHHAVQRRFPENLVVGQGDDVVVILPVSSQRPGGTRRVAEYLRAEITRLNPELHCYIGIGAESKDVGELPRYYRQAQRALDVARTLGSAEGIACISDLGVYGLLFRRDDHAELLAFASHLLNPLFAYDREHGTALVATLRTYLEHQGNSAQAARVLFIHVNTLRYRLARIEKLTDQNLRDATACLNFNLALNIHDIAQRTPLVSRPATGGAR